MRATWTAAALTAVLSLTTVTLASADVVSPGHSHGSSVNHHPISVAPPAADNPPASDPAAGVPAGAPAAPVAPDPGAGAPGGVPVAPVAPDPGGVPVTVPVTVPKPADPAVTMAALSQLGDVLKQVSSLSTAATQPTSAPSAQAAPNGILDGILKVLLDLINSLLKLLGLPPITLPADQLPAGQQAKPVPPGNLPPAGVSPSDTLNKVHEDGKALVAAATAAKPDPAAIKAANQQLSLDTLTATTAVTTALAGK